MGMAFYEKERRWAGMSENEVKTINIPIDEYFDLRTRAEMNGILMERLGQFEGRFFDLDRRMYELECKLKGGAE
jgi:hypothetical protein